MEKPILLVSERFSKGSILDQLCNYYSAWFLIAMYVQYYSKEPRGGVGEGIEFKGGLPAIIFQFLKFYQCSIFCILI
jgi:hypothetical protein